MSTQSRLEFETRIQARNNGNINGLKAIIAGLGRSAAQSGKCVFSNPYEAGSEDAEIWVNAYIEQQNKLRASN